ncbi:hypothetical protein RIF29_10650 [Crotalaria pallida]|uniref:Uncharacterized protein n=1 Tax=Crotalaria pallida TaxID=3830 RepID=A0AAN9FT31_CROPI
MMNCKHNVAEFNAPSAFTSGVVQAGEQPESNTMVGSFGGRLETIDLFVKYPQHVALGICAGELCMLLICIFLKYRKMTVTLDDVSNILHIFVKGHFVAPTSLKDGPTVDALILFLRCNIIDANFAFSDGCFKFSWLMSEYVKHKEVKNHDEAMRIIYCS